MSKQLQEEIQAPPASLPDQEAVRRAADLPDLSSRLQSRQQLIRRRTITGREFTVLTLASIAMAVLLFGGVLLSQHPAPTTSSTASTSSASTSANTAPSVAVPPTKPMTPMLLRPCRARQ